jgi:predicted lipoprotein with Yx(FWY)xxD motif
VNRRPKESDPVRSHIRSRRLAVALVAVLAALAVPVFASASATLRISTAHNAKLGKTVLVTKKGRTLYTLSSEGHGKFTCKKACFANWPPLKIAKGAKPVGAKHLGMVKRREGFWQVTWNGKPLYTFAGDAKKGDVNGEGIRADGGVWRAAALASTTTTTPAPTPAPPMPAY